jgi:hypothetical protein
MCSGVICSGTVLCFVYLERHVKTLTCFNVTGSLLFCAVSHRGQSHVYCLQMFGFDVKPVLLFDVLNVVCQVSYCLVTSG